MRNWYWKIILECHSHSPCSSKREEIKKLLTYIIRSSQYFICQGSAGYGCILWRSVFINIHFFLSYHNIYIYTQRKSPAFSTSSLFYLVGILTLYGYLCYINIDSEFWLEKFGPVSNPKAYLCVVTQSS